MSTHSVVVEDKTEPRVEAIAGIEADTIAKLFLSNCERFGDKHVCMRSKQYGIWKKYTWKDVFEEVKSFSLGLMSLGLEPGDRVGVITENSPALFWACFAVEAARGIAATALPDSSAQELKHILSVAEVKFVVTEDQEQVDKVLEIKDDLPRLSRIIYWEPKGMWKYDYPILASFREVQELGREYEKLHPTIFKESIDQGKPDDMIALVFSSGTTGLQKGTILTNRVVMERAYRVVLALKPPKFMQYLSYLPGWDQDFGMGAGLLAPFILNFAEDPGTVLEDIREIGTEMVMFTSKQWESYARTVQAKMMDASWLGRLAYNAAVRVGYEVASARHNGKQAGIIWRLLMPVAHWSVLRALLDQIGLLKVRYAMVGGTATAPELLGFMHALGVRLRQLYGSSETGMLTLHLGDRFDVNTVGKLLPVHPALGSPLEYKIEDGEFLFKGGAVFQGYYNMPEITQKKVVDGWFHTGDALYGTPEGELVFLDRVSDLRELASGHRFPPQFIESRLRFCPFIKDAMAIGDPEKGFVSALVNIDRETTGRWMEQHKLSYGTFPELSQHPAICDLIRREIAKLNSNLPLESRVARFVNLPKELDPDEGELTRSRKVKRGFIEERYKDLIDAVYRGIDEFPAEVPVKYRDGRTAVVRVSTKINTVQSE